MRALGAGLAYLVVGVAFGFLGLLLGTSLVQGADNSGHMIVGVIIAGGLLALGTGILIPAPEDRTFRLLFLALCTLFAGMTVGGFISIHSL